MKPEIKKNPKLKHKIQKINQIKNFYLHLRTLLTRNPVFQQKDKNLYYLSEKRLPVKKFYNLIRAIFLKNHYQNSLNNQQKKYKN